MYLSIIFHLVLLSTFWCVGVYMISRDKGDALYFLKALTENWPAVLHKPIIGCINCMASIHTALIMVIYFTMDGGILRLPWLDLLLIWLVVAVIVAGTNGIIYTLYRCLEIFMKYNEHLEKQEMEDEESNTIKSSL